MSLGLAWLPPDPPEEGLGLALDDWPSDGCAEGCEDCPEPPPHAVTKSKRSTVKKAAVFFQSNFLFMFVPPTKLFEINKGTPLVITPYFLYRA